MAFILKNSVMIHAPKTGGTWAYTALHEQGCVRGILWSADNNPHPSTAEVRAMLGDVFTFAFVRRPVRWLRSYWAASFINRGMGADRVRFGRSPWAEFAECEAPTFLIFATRYLEQCPGAVGRLFARYTDGIDFVCRYESLQADLASALQRAGEAVDFDRIADMAPVNRAASMPLGELAEIPESVAQAIRQAEREYLGAHYPELAVAA